MTGRAGYGMTQEEAALCGAPPCPRCGQLADGMSEHAFFMYDVVAARCTPCRLWTIVESDEPWILFPAKDDPDWPIRTQEAWQQLETRAKAVHERKSARRSE